ncbi:MAG: helix-turn-helix domain-containing protein [Deltaproteobacteria bacterium]|nr:helix-turn-helix domain-containing protein [Deltaproteobacteria bacterium]
MNITKRNKTIIDAVMNYGYSQKEIADMLGLHYSMISRLLKKHYEQE